MAFPTEQGGTTTFTKSGSSQIQIHNEYPVGGAVPCCTIKEFLL